MRLRKFRIQFYDRLAEQYKSKEAFYFISQAFLYINYPLSAAVEEKVVAREWWEEWSQFMLSSSSTKLRTSHLFAICEGREHKRLLGWWLPTTNALDHASSELATGAIIQTFLNKFTLDLCGTYPNFKQTMAWYFSSSREGEEISGENLLNLLY